VNKKNGMTDSFFSSFNSETIINEKIAKGDTVRVVGKDQFKGQIGCVISVDEISGEAIYTVELEADTTRIERFAASLRKEFA
jgi:hypothetical protein